MTIPGNLLYSKTHEWILINGNAARVGLTDFAQDALGDVVYFNLPEPGAAAAAGDVIGEVESVKAVSEIFAPVSGVVSAVNARLSESPETVNSAPYDAWIFEMEGVEGIEGLLTPGEYEAFCAEGVN